MEFQLEQRDGRWCASGDMTIYSAAVMKQRVLASMESAGDDVLLDLSQVTELDTCGLQILLLAERQAASEGRRLKLIEPSAATREVLTLCGLDRLRGGASPRGA